MLQHEPTYLHTYTHTGSVAVLCRSAGYYQLLTPFATVYRVIGQECGLELDLRERRYIVALHRGTLQ